MHRFSLRLSDPLWNRLRELARSQRVSLNSFLVGVLTGYALAQPLPGEKDKDDEHPL